MKKIITRFQSIGSISTIAMAINNAREWLALDPTPASLEQYFERWRHWPASIWPYAVAQKLGEIAEGLRPEAEPVPQWAETVKDLIKRFRNFVRWLFEDSPRGIMYRPKLWRRGALSGPGAYR